LWSHNPTFTNSALLTVSAQKNQLFNFQTLYKGTNLSEVGENPQEIGPGELETQLQTGHLRETVPKFQMPTSHDYFAFHQHKIGTFSRPFCSFFH
jgi:hypothetical protein